MRYIVFFLTALFISGCAYTPDSGWSETDGASYSQWDVNDDDMLDEEEFGAGFEDSGFFDDWDTNSDGFLEEEEFGTGLYDTYDRDDSGYLEEEEFEETGFWGF